jgi:D-glycero-alpha-D-manno-heptose-7-phosphate kinase
MGSGAYGLKVSGAGGGGFMIIYCDPSLRYKVTAILTEKYEGSVFRFGFTIKGAEAWKIK